MIDALSVCLGLIVMAASVLIGFRARTISHAMRPIRDPIFVMIIRRYMEAFHGRGLGDASSRGLTATWSPSQGTRRGSGAASRRSASASCWGTRAPLPPPDTTPGPARGRRSPRSANHGKCLRKHLLKPLPEHIRGSEMAGKSRDITMIALIFEPTVWQSRAEAKNGEQEGRVV